MKVVRIHSAHDLRVEDQPKDAVGLTQVEIAVRSGGICGSDLHYYHEGGFGAVRLREPMTLGHEVSGEVVAKGAAVTTLKIGDHVSVNPSRPCGDCDFCQSGLQNHCRNMLFYGSAMRLPHVQGAFRERLIAEEGQCCIMPASTSWGAAAMCEPFAVALHAVARAGPLIDRKVLVTGCGPIGSLVALAARLHGAREIVVTDIVDETLQRVRLLAADRVVNIADEPETMTGFAANKGTFDVLFEASGNPAAIISGIAALKPRGVLVQIGLGGAMDLPQDVVVTREIEVRGAFRFVSEFALAAILIGGGRADVQQLITQEYEFADAKEAFDAASDRRRAMKVQLLFRD